MFSLNDITLSEIGYGARYLQYAVVGPGTQTKLLDGYLQKPIGTIFYLAVFPDLPGLHTGVAIDSRSSEAFVLDLTRSINALSNFVGTLPCRFRSSEDQRGVRTGSGVSSSLYLG
jgi:hypothetical protein